MILNTQKVKNALLYFAYNTNPQKFGKTKLLKLFYLLDFMHLKRYGRVVFGDNYKRLDHGPVPLMVKNFLDEIDAGDISTSNELKDVCKIIKRPLLMRGGEQHLVVPTKKEDTINEKCFSESERKILSEIAEIWKNSTAKEIEDFTHEQAAWKYTEKFGDIDYNLAAQDEDCEFGPAVLRKCLEIYQEV